MEVPMNWWLTAVLLSGVSLVSACGGSDSEAEIEHFCAALEEVNRGSVDTTGLAELQGHALVAHTLLEQAPPSLVEDLTRIYETVNAWARAVSGDHPMRDTFEKLSAPELIGSEGRVTDFAAEHCGIDLGGPRWVEAERPNAEDLCPGWPRVGTPLTFNHFPNLPDIAGSNYFSQSFLISDASRMAGLKTLKGAFVVERGGKAVFRGQYPKTRYFAYHPNDMDLNNLKTLRDRELDPDPGSVNPFREVAPAGSENRYTATLVFGPPPADPEPNTSYVGVRKDGVTENPFLMNMLRMYHIDAGNGTGSGEVPLPALSIYDADGERVQHFEECEMFGPDIRVIRTERVYPSLPIIDHRPKNPPQWTTSSNFDAPSDTLANADVQYLATQYSERYGDLLVTRAKYLTAPDTRNGESPAAPDKQVRLYNLCTYNFWNGGATQCMLENQLSRDEGGFYTLIVSKRADRPTNLEETHASWLDWGPYMDGQLTYRYVYRENPYVAAIAAAAEGRPIADELRPYVPASVPCDRAIYEAGGWQACFEENGREVAPHL
ncbi:MAG: hypothetical protein JRH16_12115 [Deltaproteobacteria bacterium]|nr:hypothetical protein [Deltaproteobacteria bacterium]